LKEPLAAADLFDLIWNGLVEVLGTAAAAVLVRRAAKHVASCTPDLPTIIVNRKAVTYEYEVPAVWRRPGDPRASASLQALAEALGVLLEELTGVVVIRRLERIDALRDAQISFRRELTRE
jgi:hypothetical protein